MKKLWVISIIFYLGISVVEAKLFSKEAVEYRMKGYLAWQNKDYDEAIKYLQKSCLLDPCYAPPHNDLGVIYELKGWLERAEGEYLRAISIDPNYGEAMINLALLYLSKGLKDKAIPYLQKRVELGPPQDPWVLKAKDLLSQYAPELYKEISQKEEAKNLMYQVLEEKLKPSPPITKEEKLGIEKEPEMVLSKEIENYLRLERDISRPEMRRYLFELSPQGIIFLYGEPYQKRVVKRDKEVVQPEWYNRWINDSEFNKATRELFTQDGIRRREKWIYKIPSKYEEYVLKKEIVLIFEDNKLVSIEK